MDKKILVSIAIVGILIIVGVAVGVAVSMKDEPDSDVPGDPINPEDIIAAAQVQEEAYDLGDLMQNQHMFEGDIDNIDPSVGKNAIRGEWRRWKNANIPYVIASSFSKRDRSVIAKAMEEYHEKTCIKFVSRTSERGYVYIAPGSGCSSSVGRTGSRQQVSLGRGCVYTGIVIHEFMHALGFFHEQSRTDRDEYVTIQFQNIRSNMAYNFEKYTQDKIDHLGAEYDTCSIMHYGSTAFAKTRGLKTIVKKKGKCEIGQRNGFSDTDVRKINTLYKCEGYPQVGKGVTAPPTEPTTTAKPGCEDNHKWCKWWAGNGECKNTRHASWMAVNCPKSCDQCGASCEDRKSSCQSWASNGWCDRSPRYMTTYCAKSCKKC